MALLLPSQATIGQMPTTTELARRIDSAATDLVAKKATAGLAIGVSRGGKTVYTKGFGQADLEAGVAADAGTVFLIGSITKQFTAASILQLIERGKLKLDDHLTTYFPDWPAPADQVTVRQLLNHTSGIKSYTGLPGWRVYQRQALSHDSLLGFVRSVPFDFPPGTDFRYNNSGYYILGVLIEKLSGQTYPEYLAKHVFEPLGMTGSRYCDHRPLIPHRSHGYALRPDGFQNADPLDMGNPFAAGALCSTVGDLLTWTRALEAGKVIGQESYRVMTTPVPLPNGALQRYAFGLGIGTLDGHRSVSHNGGINGFRSQMASYPDDSLIVTVLANTETDLPDKLEKTISRWALGIPIIPPKNLAITSSDIERLSGRYATTAAGVRVWGESGRLVMALPGRTGPLLAQGDDRFVLESDPDFQLRFVGGGAHPEHVEVTAPGGQMLLPRQQ